MGVKETIMRFLGIKRKKTEEERAFYNRWGEAEDERQRGERIYYKPTKGYYIVKPKRRDRWNI